ncbi:PPOX class F420-dependent oxidoreductase [Herbiconiux moechotypicola]|uniref:F420-dependent biliverdin reductase n=1 Tax=Herbiconiux moechotypicola TaxID=637393 RepID=A0ABN3D9Z1_9MICO|nr:PPOX class F420-dependent oxidoreductase [Herbiconiux moechotypicola]MCS5729097.1 PPOX class F420-dependent oxidoreductase [Herbiconiux moechotypicola]
MPELLTPAGLSFVSEYHLATLTTLLGDGSPHVVPVGFTFDAATGIVRVITSGTSQKALNARRDPRVAVSQVDGGRWLTFSGRAQVLTDEASVRDAVERYTVRYRAPRPNPLRVALAFETTRLLGSPELIARPH